MRINRRTERNHTCFVECRPTWRAGNTLGLHYRVAAGSRSHLFRRTAGGWSSCPAFLSFACPDPTAHMSRKTSRRTSSPVGDHLGRSYLLAGRSLVRRHFDRQSPINDVTTSSSSSWRRRKQAISGLYIREIHLES